MLQLNFMRLPHSRGLEAPAYASAGASGLDLRACLESPVTIAAGASALVPTGFAVEIPQGYEGQVRPRSGLALKSRVMVVNSPGTIDCDYRGELKIILGNFGAEPFTIAHGDRIAQLCICPVARCDVREVKELSSSDRAAGGFGSTGKA